MGDAVELHQQHHLGDGVPSLSLQQLKVVSAVGRGAKGVVFLVQSGDSGELWALKVILRCSIEMKSKDSAAKDGTEYRRILFEQQVLRQFDHWLLPKLRGVLATDKVVGYAIDYCPGGDLTSLRKKQSENMFSDEIIRFYAAEMVLALEYLHSLGIVYRDLKPENIMIQEDGHIMLVDFDLSTKLISTRLSPQSSPTPDPPHPPDSSRRNPSSRPLCRWCSSGFPAADCEPPHHHRPSPNSVFPAESNSVEKSNSFVGTEEYVAPEVITGNGHDFNVDWWSLGVVLYEMLYGTTPFHGSNRKETFYKILNQPLELVGETTPLRDLIGKLLVRDPRRRIGPEGIKGHDFFRGLTWQSVVEISRPPFIPPSIVDGEVINKEIDVEQFVEGIFGSEKDTNNNNNINDNNNNNNNNDINNDISNNKNNEIGENGNKRSRVDESDGHRSSKVDEEYFVF